jgi:hypothetical protein
MPNELTLASLRSDVGPLLAPTVSEVSFVPDESGGTWTLLGSATGVSCEVEQSGNWFVQLDDWYVVELFPIGETRLVGFLAAFDVEPIELVTARIGTKVVGSWLRFADGEEFEDPTLLDKLTAMAPRYSLEVTAWVPGIERMDLLPR